MKFRRGPCVTIHGGLRGYGGMISDSSDMAAAGNLLMVLMKAVAKKIERLKEHVRTKIILINIYYIIL